jgi:hypothetical protein
VLGIKGRRGRGGIAGYKTERRARVDDTANPEYMEGIGTKIDGKRRKGNEWKEANTEGSKDSGCADLTVSSLVAARDSYRAATMLAGCEEWLYALWRSFV